MQTGSGMVLKGRVVEIEKGMGMSRVKVAVGNLGIIIVLVSEAALEELAAGVGDELEVFKVMAAGDLH